MSRKQWKPILIIALLALSIWLLYPSCSFYTLSDEDKARLSTEEIDNYTENAIKLGLDLQGGMHLVLEVDDTELDDNAKKDALPRAIEIIRNRVDQFGVSEPVIQAQGDRRIIVQLPGLQDAERARGLIGQTALLEFRLVRENDEVGRVLNALDRGLKGVTVEGTVVDTTGADDDAATDTGDLDSSELAVDTPAEGTDRTADTSADSLLQMLSGGEESDVAVPLVADEDRPFTAFLVSGADGGVVVDERLVPTVTALLATEQAQRMMPGSSEFIWGHEARPLQDGTDARVLYLVEKRATLDGSFLIDAVTRPDPDDPTQLNVGFRLNRAGAIIFARFTGENIGRRIAIVLDDKIRSAPVVQSKIPGGEGRITGLDNDEEAGDLAIVLRAGALPAPVKIIEERTVGPTLGHDSIVAGTRAALGGFAIVLVFMLIYYKGAGLLACFALVFNLLLILAALAKLHAALTLPGIAGLILTIGMAIDANVLIFERIREELGKAKTVRAAIESGYDRAFTTILDANVTTLITAFVLWQFGTGPIKGFATTLALGILASMFTALFCTRVVFDIITSRKQLKSLSI
jgi:protein-export membrane protein SecD